MRKRFWIGSIICLFTACSVFTFIALAHEHVECKGPQICAGARVDGGTKLFAWARASSPNSVAGEWGYKVKAGKYQEGPKTDIYRKGCSETWEVSDYTANATAYGQNRGKTKNGKVFFASKSASSGG